ncbi:uncharacterized protein LOC6046277 [Culex quinquefasciatus]|uniref:uncharacterized protein LOC6046277 n=1 Tax=Culex quinquefasciatus TaxID=7176 RepID=UPI0018E327D5|nr:uncharacterized protein LOC6046277 [Culex quinquefasciatus]XP_038116453.1 uncharacterized protein LOC6046277 [Culex quinquefasciatus]
MLRGLLSQAAKFYSRTTTTSQIRFTGSNVPSSFDLHPSNAATPTEVYLNALKCATDTKQVLELMPALDKRKSDRQTLTLAALKGLFELHKQNRTTLQRQDVLHHPRFAELCKALKYESRGLVMNDITESLKILTYFGVRSNSEIMTVLLQLLRHQINDVTLDHVVFLDFILKKMDQSPLVEALQLALPMLLQIQISYKMDHENVQQLVELFGFISQHRVSDRCVTNVVSALILHGSNLSGHQAADVLKVLVDFNSFEPLHLKLLENVFGALNGKIEEIGFKMMNYIMKKIVSKNLDKYPMLYNEEFFQRCAQFVVESDVGLLNALYFQKKLNKVAYIHVPLLDYISSMATNLSIVPTTSILAIVGAFSNANYRPANWDQVKVEIAKHSSISNPAIPWIRYNLELLSMDIFNDTILKQHLEPAALDKSMARNTVVDYLQLLELTQTLQLLHPGYDGPLPDRRYLEKGTVLLFQDNDLPLQKPLEFAFGGEGSVLTQVTSSHGHVLDHVIVFGADGQVVRQPIQSDDDDQRVQARLEDLQREGNKIVVVLCLSRSYYALNVNRLRGRFAMYVRTIEALGVRVVPVSYQFWSNLPEHERIPYLEREVRIKLES